MGRYYGSEALRDPKLQKKTVNYSIDKLNPMIQNVGSQALDQLSTKIRPKKKYKTNRKKLDGVYIAVNQQLQIRLLKVFLCLLTQQHLGVRRLNYLVVRV